VTWLEELALYCDKVELEVRKPPLAIHEKGELFVHAEKTTDGVLHCMRQAIAVDLMRQADCSVLDMAAEKIYRAMVASACDEQVQREAVREQ
jgi:hypothetical protein